MVEQVRRSKKAKLMTGSSLIVLDGLTEVPQSYLFTDAQWFCQ